MCTAVVHHQFLVVVEIDIEADLQQRLPLERVLEFGHRQRFVVGTVEQTAQFGAEPVGDVPPVGQVLPELDDRLLAVVELEVVERGDQPGELPEPLGRVGISVPRVIGERSAEGAYTLRDVACSFDHCSHAIGGPRRACRTPQSTVNSGVTSGLRPTMTGASRSSSALR